MVIERSKISYTTIVSCIVFCERCSSAYDFFALYDTMRNTMDYTHICTKKDGEPYSLEFAQYGVLQNKMC